MMCLNSESAFQSPKDTLSWKVGGLAMLPAAPMCPRLPLSQMKHDALDANLDHFRLPFPLLPSSDKEGSASTPLQLVMSSSRSEHVSQALHRLSTTPARKEPSQAPLEKADKSKDETVALAERMARLMPANAKGRNRSNRRLGNAGPKSNRRATSPVPLVRGVQRSNSGAALCA
ncbi:expressed unknown protein [Seminavis robusta]|uniref:Uncharacterized protein n=1 Tax=Seminavis robusta TaxID=568900 RepID=A0A9N8EAK7_9STRA|nr:expressed unknown protein [Seminavis robusta]|eukprot:Sro866_g213000.1 n/a (174) ;mRNA; r:18223-18744